jgi:hypothetical protein
MNKLKPLLIGCALALQAAAAELPYQMNFEQAEVGSLPGEFLVLDGNFEVKESAGNKFLQLPGAPLDNFGLLFGPALKEDAVASARFFGEAKGRRYPTFEVGLNGVGGYRLKVSPGRKQLELYRSDALKKSIPLDWKPGRWTHLKLTVLNEGGKWSVSGKFWQEGASEPAEPSIAHVDSEAPPNGRASIFGSPFSGAPILFDDLLVTAAK